MSGSMADLPADQAGESFSGKSGGEPFLVSPSDLLRWAESLAASSCSASVTSGPRLRRRGAPSLSTFFRLRRWW